MCPRHPQIKRVMKKGVREDRADHTPLRGTTGSLDLNTLLIHHRRRQPSLDVQQRPWARHVSAHGPQQELVVDVVEQALDIELKNPVIFPATLARYPDSVEG